jgi:ribonucleoside-diphosphate reductase alpha chain
MSYFKQAISEYVWDTKYRHKQAEKIIDTTIEQTWQRVAKAVSLNEPLKKQNFWLNKYFQLLEDFKFLPGGRILAGAGINKKVTLFNCFVMNIKKDSLEAIFEALKEGALTLQQGGGIGYDFSILRPSGYACRKTNSYSSGPVSFMQIWDSMCATMLSSSARRGAMMANLRCDHPDIFQFIRMKLNPRELRHFNLSVIVTNEFMRAVAENAKWELVFPTQYKSKNTILRRWSGSSKPIPCEIIQTINARDLWEEIIYSAYQYAEPGVIFEDTINENNPLWYCEWISATNPCGEIPLPPYGACNLGSINLTKYITEPFTPQAKINWQQLEDSISLATRFLDNIIDISRFPLPKQKKAAVNTRRIGLGFTGLADLFVMLNIEYGSKESLQLATELAKKLAYTTWLASAELAKEKGSFPLFQEEYLEGKFVKTLPEEIIHTIKQCGMRNSHHNAIAPTGTISLFANNISSGIEPIFSTTYRREVKALDKKIEFQIDDYAYSYFKKTTNSGALPEKWKEVSALQPLEHLAIQSAVQPFLDNAISKTINIPVDYPFKDLIKIYQDAYQMNLKGCTIFRPNPITGEVISTDDTDKACCE